MILLAPTRTRRFSSSVRSFYRRQRAVCRTAARCGDPVRHRNIKPALAMLRCGTSRFPAFDACAIAPSAPRLGSGRPQRLRLRKMMDFLSRDADQGKEGTSDFSSSDGPSHYMKVLVDSFACGLVCNDDSTRAAHLLMAIQLQAGHTLSSREVRGRRPTQRRIRHVCARLLAWRPPVSLRLNVPSALRPATLTSVCAVCSASEVPRGGCGSDEADQA